MCPFSTDFITARLSAYADDVTEVIRSDEDGKKLVASLDFF